MESDSFMLDGLIEARSFDNVLRLQQYEIGEVHLSLQAQRDLLEWLRKKFDNPTRVIDAEEYHYPPQRSSGQLLHESGEDLHLFLAPDENLP